MTPVVRLLWGICAIACATWPAASVAEEAGDTARVIAGFPASPASFAAAGSASWRAYSREVSSHWIEYERRIGQPMREWGCRELNHARGVTVFYPFSGPDLPSVVQLFPDADRYVLVSLQKAGAPPGLEDLSRGELESYLVAVRKAWRFFGTLGFFRTDDLEAVANAHGTRIGMTGPLLAFAARLGFEIDAIEPIRLEGAGATVEYASLRGEASAVDGAWNSVRITLRKDRRTVLVDYVQMDLSDAWLSGYAPGRDWLERMAGNPTVLKAASHHLQSPEFSFVRDSVLLNAPSIVQDETGIEYGALTEAFEVRLYGKFTGPNRSFSSDLQRNLAQAYRSRKGAEVKALPFRLGYEKRSGSALQVAVRKSNAAAPPRDCARAALRATAGTGR